MKFLNCNYPGRFQVKKGKYKCLKSAMFQMKLNGITLIEQKHGTIWFVECGYYWGIELDIKKDGLGFVDGFGTVGAVNIALLDWSEQPLDNVKEDLLYKYLKIIS